MEKQYIEVSSKIKSTCATRKYTRDRDVPVILSNLKECHALLDAFIVEYF